MLTARSQLGPFTRTGVAIALLGAGCYVAGWRLGWIELMVAAAGALLALLAAIPFVVGRIPLEITRTVDPVRVMVGTTATASLIAHNTGSRRTRAVTIDDVIGDRTVPITIPPLAAGDVHPVVYPLPTGRRAKVRIGPAEVSRSDPLGLLRRQVSQAAATTLWVHPRWLLVDPLPSGFAKDLEGPTSDTSPAGDIAFHALRPYQLGDDRRHIHWMSTARSGTLMVRHYVDNRRPALGVVFDDEAAVYDGEQFELAVQITTSLVMSSLSMRLPVAARTGSEWLLGRLRPQPHEAVLEQLTVVAPDADARPLLAVAAELLRVENATSAVAIVTGGRPAADLMAAITHLRRRARVIVIIAGGSVRPDPEIVALPGATVLRVDDLDGFQAAWNRIAS